MSYSFRVQGADKRAAAALAEEKFDEVIANQAVHARDKDAVMSNIDAVLALLADDDTKDVAINVNGYVSWLNPPDQEPVFSSVSVCASAGHIERMVK